MNTGVYKITCLATGLIYIGSSSTSLKARWLTHKAQLRSGRHYNSRLQRVWDKYGEVKLRFYVLEFCSPQLCVTREQYWIDKLSSKLGNLVCNHYKKVVKTALGSKRSEECKMQMSINRKGLTPTEATKAAAKVNKGKHRPQEVRKKISVAKQGVKLSNEHCESIKASHWSKRPDAHLIAEKSASKQRGRKQSPESIEKRRQANLRAWAKKKALQSDSVE